MAQLMEQLGLEPRLLLMQAISFLALFWVLKRFLFGPIGNMVQSRNDEIRDRLDRAERDEKAKEAIRTEYERRIAEIETEARDRIQRAVAEAERIAEGIRAQAAEEAEAARQRGYLQIEREKEKALKEIQDQIVDLSIDAAERVVHQALNEDSQRQLVRRFIGELDSQVPS
ncbi:MAG: F0F1 ATP synthase subunit B [Armatimonadetes bacterium]|jgi:F-type H+-transporting ATPase subunit b|nr:F0F1 ATP synthase subunit B [Armatimonadota bacterium]MDI9603578.1 F0F1 ATP synthase subunit B [Acidobacteriota bacterium]